MISLIKKFYRTTIGKFISILSTFLFTFYITKSFKIEDSGKLFFIFSILQFFVMLSRFGQEQIIIKKLSSIVNNQSKIKSAGISSSMILIIFLSNLIIIFNFSVYEYFYPILFKISFNKIVFISILPLSLIWLFVGIFKALNLQFFTNFYENGLFYIIFIISCIFFVDPEVESYLMTYTVSSILAFILILFHLFSKGMRIGLNLKFTEIKSSLNVTLSSFGNYVIINSPIYLSALFLNTVDITLYSVFLRISFLVSIGMAIVNSLYAPKFAEHYSQRDFIKLRYLYNKSRIELIFISIFPVLFILFFSNQFLTFFSIEINSSTSLLLILFCIVQFLCISTGPTGLFLNLTGNDKFLKNNIYVGLFISLSIGLLLIKSYGIYGMLASYCCGVIFENFKSLFTVKNYLNCNEGIST